jgi:hypothetical protein
MAWTEQDLREIEDELKKDSQGVGDVPEAESLDGITSLPAYQEKDGEEIIVRAPLELLAAPALEAADKANEAADKAESNATTAQTAANTANEKAELAAQAASDANAAKEGAETATQSANNAASNANEKAVLADTAAANANDTAEHPTYIGQDHYVYKWNKTAQAYDKTDIYTKGDAFSIKKVYASVAELEADKGNPDIAEGDFVLVNTGDVEDPDNAKLYVKAGGNYEFLVDMSGAIGFTGKTPQFSMGTISTLEAGSTATATISEDGVDSDGNPKYKINFAIPRGNPGAPFRVAGEYATLEALKSAVPDGSAVDGFMAVGTEAPYDYYAWVNGDWANQGKIAGGGSGNVVVIPAATTSLSDQSTSEEIFEVFGGKQSLIDIIKEIKSTEDCIVVASDNDINSASKIVFSSVSVVYTDDNNMALSLIAWTVNITAQMVIQIVNGVASCLLNTTPLMTEAPSNGNAYGRKNKGWVEVPEKSDVLTKDNETEFTPTQDYHPATKKYVDDKTFVRDVDGTILNKWINNTVITGETVQDLADELFGNFRSFAENYSDGNYTGLKFSTRHFDDTAGAWFGYIINANIQYCLAEAGNGYYALLFTFGYGSTLKSCYIYYYDVSETSNNNKIVITDVITSDNLTTITKKTAAEYEAIGSKDANTAYCVTD